MAKLFGIPAAAVRPALPAEPAEGNGQRTEKPKRGRPEFDEQVRLVANLRGAGLMFSGSLNGVFMPAGVSGQAKAAGMITKSNLILGMGEDDTEIDTALIDLHAAGCDLLTITQYLRPSPRHHPVDRWVKPDVFVALAKRATQIGFVGVMSGPLVRSSYRAGRLYQQAMAARQ